MMPLESCAEVIRVLFSSELASTKNLGRTRTTLVWLETEMRRT